MDAVKSFNMELSALYEVKPPISKAKMTSITRGAIKAIKLYKHVVQSVEKFIQKCKPEYKVPGLYVIDSIVRQSRHQFGTEKDVFAPRFAKNIQQTFVNLFKCPPEDKSKIIRVLNLWQKNQVFPPEVIQPLFDLADPNNPIYKEIQISTPVQQNNGMNSQLITKGSPAVQKTPTKGGTQGPEISAANLNLTDPNVIQQIQQLQRMLSGKDSTSGSGGRTEGTVHFDKKLLDFDYGEEEEEPSPRPQQQMQQQQQQMQMQMQQQQQQVNAAESVASLLMNPEVLRQIQTLQQTMAVSQQEMDMDKMRKLQEMKQQEDEFDKHLAQTIPSLPFASECDFRPNNNSAMIQGYYLPPPPQDPGQQQQNYNMGQHEEKNNEHGNDVEIITLDHDSRSASPDDRYSKRKRSRSRSKSRGRDKDRDRRSRRSRSRSKGRKHRSRSRDRKDRDKKKDEKESEREKERKKRGLPAIKKDNLSVCSTTLWVGHLSKLVHQDDLSNTFGEFGDIISIDLIPPRGCAFIVMDRRQDAARCLAKLKNHVIHGKAITLAWAPGKGVKGKELKDYWEGDLGVSYIPWSKLREDMDLVALEDGGMIDEDTMPDWMRRRMEQLNSSKKSMDQPPPFLLGDGSGQGGIDTSQPPPMPGLLQPPMLPLVNPFQFPNVPNNRLLGMNVATSMMPPSLPIGVPPPNMGAPMLPNMGLGMGGSPFQGANLMPPQVSMPNKPTPPPHQQHHQANNPEATMKSLSESLMGMAQPFGMMPQPPQGTLSMSVPPPQPHMDDSMDVEMEDALGGGGGDKQQLPAMDQPPPPFRDRGGRDDDRGRGDRDRDRDRDRDGRGRRRSRSRDRGRRGGSRDRRDKDSSRGGRDRDRTRDDRRDRDRDRGNRWGPPPAADRDRRDEDKKDREKSLNDRLREMAGMAPEAPKDKDRRNASRERRGRSPAMSREDPRERSSRERRESHGSEPPTATEEPKLNFEPPPHIKDDNTAPQKEENTNNDSGQPSEGARAEDQNALPLSQPPNFMGGPPEFENDNSGFNPMMEGPDFRGPPDFGPPMDDQMGYGPPDDRMPGPDGGFNQYPMDYPPPEEDDRYMDGPPDYGPDMIMDGPGPMGFDGGPPDRFPPRGRRGGRFGGGGDRGPPPPDFFPPGGPMRGGPDFPPRGPPMMGGPRGPPPRGFFGPRGPRGPRGFRGDFNPRFDGPPDFFRGPRGPRPRMFDDRFPPRHLGPRFDDRRRGGGPPHFDRRGRPMFDGPDGPPFDGPPFDGPFGPDGPPFDGPFGPDGPPFDGPFGPDGAPFDGPFGPDGPPFDGPFGPDGPPFDGPFGPDGPPFRPDGPPFDRPFEGDGPPFRPDGPPFDGPFRDGPPMDKPPFEDRSDRGPRGRRSRWGKEEEQQQQQQQPEGNTTPLRDEMPTQEEFQPSEQRTEPQNQNDTEPVADINPVQEPANNAPPQQEPAPQEQAPAEQAAAVE